VRGRRGSDAGALKARIHGSTGHDEPDNAAHRAEDSFAATIRDRDRTSQKTVLNNRLNVMEAGRNIYSEWDAGCPP
jgi:hypothetical protein